MTDNLTAKIAGLAAKAKQGPFEAIKRTGSWFVVGADGWKLAHCYTEEDARLIEALAVNLPDILALAAELTTLRAQLAEAETRAWEQARELVRGTNADMCKDTGTTYRVIIEALTDAIHCPEHRTLEGRVAARLAKLKGSTDD